MEELHKRRYQPHHVILHNTSSAAEHKYKKHKNKLILILRYKKDVSQLI